MNTQRREIFDSFAEEYDLYRPVYPDAFMEELFRRLGLNRPALVLEVGCGSGQATAAVARMGHAVDALDISAALLEKARRRLGEGARLLNVAFEDFSAEDGIYDLVFSANAFHWVAPEVGYPKAGALLKPTAPLVLMAISRTLPSGLRGELDALYADYASVFGGVKSRHPRRDASKDAVTPLFADEGKLTHVFPVVYDAETYCGLMRTMSDHRMLPDKEQKEFFDQLARICSKYGTFTIDNTASAHILRKRT